MRREGVNLAAIVPSLAIAIMQTGAAVSLAALVFSGPASTHLATGAGTFLLGSGLTSIVLALRSSFDVVVAGARNNVTVVIAAVAASVAVAAPDQPGATVAVFVAIAALSSGALLYLTGRFGLGHLVRFVPLPVMGGYVAGTAWLMVKGGAQVMTNASLSLDTLDVLTNWPTLRLLLPGLALALLIVFLRGATVQSMLILASLVGFHVVIRVVSSPNEARDDGWVIGPLVDPGGVPLLGPSDIEAVDWSAIGGETVGLAAIALIALVGALLNVTGVEFASGVDVDINDELRASGFASGLSGLVGGTVGFVALGPTVLARQLKASSRLVTAAFVLLIAVTVIGGPGLVGWMPRFVAGALIMGPGIALFRNWMRDSMLRGPIADRIVAALIPLTIAFAGVLEGVGLGIIVAAGFFIWQYASIDPVRVDTTGLGLRSGVDRPPHESKLLSQLGDRIAVFRLEGYLFFGTASRLGDRVRTRLVDRPELEHVVLDFSRVTGADSSTRNELAKMLRHCEAAGATLHLSDMPTDLLATYEGRPEAGAAVADLDRALARAETQLLRDHAAIDRAEQQTLPEDVIAIFQPVNVQAGTTLLATGHASDNLFFVLSGSFTVWSEGPGGSRRLRQVGADAFLGEAGFFGGTAANAAVTADSDSSVLQLSRHNFEQLATTNPQLALRLTMLVLTKATERLAVTNTLVRDLMD